jgi:hypothetical protein
MWWELAVDPQKQTVALCSLGEEDKGPTWPVPRWIVLVEEVSFAAGRTGVQRAPPREVPAAHVVDPRNVYTSPPLRSPLDRLQAGRKVSLAT